MYALDDAGSDSHHGDRARGAASGKPLPPVDPAKELDVVPTPRVGYATLVRMFFREYPRRSISVAR
jgi:hypothetical protein